MAPNKIPIQGRRLRNSPKETEVLVRWPQRSEFPNVVAKAIQPPWPPPPIGVRVEYRVLDACAWLSRRVPSPAAL
jgi:hypothetical protein